MRFTVSCLLVLQASLFAHEATLSLGGLGSVRYTYDEEHLFEIDRLSPLGEVMYTHSYNYSEEGRLISENLIGNLGEIVYQGNGVVKSPYHLEICEYDERGNLVRHTQDEVIREYSYNDLNELISEEVGELCEYDERGNLIQKGDTYFGYDGENRLVSIVRDNFEMTCTYDEAGRRISKSVNGKREGFFYFGNNEIGIVDGEGKLKGLRIPGISSHKEILRPIAIETRDAIYAPIHDVQGNIVKLADPFGRGLSKDSPTAWIFSGKHYDKEVDLVYFGARYYSPELKKWLTFDPACQTSDLYQYCFNNPFSYVDPDGEWAIPLISIAWGAGATITAPVWAPYALAVGAGATVGYWGYKAYEYWQEKKGEPPYNGKELGEDASKRPDKGFEWRGNNNPKSGKGSWYNPKKKESLHPDFNHAGDVKPHWDYKGPGGEEARIYTDGTWEWK
jgi:RHS repeat-associated protein